MQHSKKNFVECVHAEENGVLSKHGLFVSQKVHKDLLLALMSTGKTWNLWQMRLQFTDGNIWKKKPLLCYRGIKHNDFVFDDEDGLSIFLTLSEQGKQV